MEVIIMATKIRNIREGDAAETARPPEGIPGYPQEKYKGIATETPTCSKPQGENTGCDAWNQCSTKGEGPYNVVYKNTSKDAISSCHCRLWHYRLKRKADKYQPIDEPWIPTVESIAIDPKDINKGTRRKHYDVFIDNARMPFPGAHVHTLDEYEDVSSSSDPDPTAPQVQMPSIPEHYREIDRKDFAYIPEPTFTPPTILEEIHEERPKPKTRLKKKA